MRQPCLGILVCAIPGILLSEWAACSLPLAALAAVCFAAAAFRWRRALPCCLLILTTFLIRHELDWRRNPGRLPIELLNTGTSVVHVLGTVTSDPVPAGYVFHAVRSRFEMHVSSLSFDGHTIQTDFPAQIVWTGTPPQWGDEITLDGTVTPIPPPRNPGEFDISSYLSRRGIFAQIDCKYAADNHLLAHGKGNPLLAWARNCRAFLQRRLSAGLEDDPEIAGLVQTITLGLKDETSIADRDLFQHVGALHLFVVNGLHIALLAGIISLLLKPLRIYRRTFAAIIIPILFAYALVTGLNPGSVRAALMAAVIFGASFVDRKPLSFNTLAAAALILLLWDTNELFKEGFQFSFGVVASIILLGGLIQKLLLPAGSPDPFLPRTLWSPLQRGQELCWRKVSGLAAVSVAASAGSFPFSAGYFNLVTPSGFLANLLLVPIAFSILAESVFSLIASAYSPAAVLFNNVNWLLGFIMLRIVHFFALLPGGHFFVSTSSEPQPECRFTILDLSPAQAIVIQSQGATWLVDCGNSSAYSRIVRPFLQSRGVNHLTGFILTHGAAASIGAAQEVIDDYSPEEILESSLTDRSPARKALHASLEKAGQPKTILESGDEFPMSRPVICTVLFPPAGFAGRTASDKSLVLRIQDGHSSVLLMSDSGFTGEHWLLDHSRDLRASVVVLGGLSGDLEGDDGFIAAVHPMAVVRGEPGYQGSAAQDRHWAGGMYRQGVTPYLQTNTGAVTIDISPAHVTLTPFIKLQ